MALAAQQQPHLARPQHRANRDRSRSASISSDLIITPIPATRPAGQPLMLVPHQATFARLTIRRRRGLAVLRLRQAM
jgi:hypothetical protein